MTAAAAEARMPRWAKIALIGSLAVNVAVAGLVIGVLLRAEPPPWDRAFTMPVEGFRLVAVAMAPEDRRALRRDLRGWRAEISQGGATLRESRAAFLAAVRAEPFSEPALTQVLDRQAAAFAEVGAWGREVLVRRIAAMTPEARDAFADTLERHMKRPRRGPQDRRPRDDR